MWPQLTVTCPWCGEPGDLTIDPGGGTDQEYVEDCAVCCRPWLIRVRIGPGGIPDVEVTRAW